MNFLLSKTFQPIRFQGPKKREKKKGLELGKANTKQEQQIQCGVGLNAIAKRCPIRKIFSIFLILYLNYD
jgi:hypothetical protein